MEQGLTIMEKFDDCTGGKGLIFGSLAVIVAAMIIAVLGTGCVYKGGKVIEGTNLSVGFTVPGTDGSLQFNVLEYVGGMRIAVAENAAVTITRTNSVHNSYFGVITVHEDSVITAEINPCEVGSTNAPPETASN